MLCIYYVGARYVIYTKTSRTPNYINLSFESNTLRDDTSNMRALVKKDCDSFELRILYNLFIVITVDF